MCAVCSCTSSVLTCDAHLFLADVAVTLSLVAAFTRRPLPALRELRLCPIRSNPLDFAHAGSRATALPRCATRLPTALQSVCQALACRWREG